MKGYRQALAQAGIACDEALVAQGDYTEDSGYYAAQRLLPAEPTAIFAASDSMAIGAIKALTQAGRRVPEDISVGGYDDAPAATLVNPPLTTVQQLVIDLGKTAAEKLISLLGEPQRPYSDAAFVYPFDRASINTGSVHLSLKGGHPANIAPNRHLASH